MRKKIENLKKKLTPIKRKSIIFDEFKTFLMDSETAAFHQNDNIMLNEVDLKSLPNKNTSNDCRNFNLNTLNYVPVYIHESDIIQGSKGVLRIIRPYWNLNFVLFKNFTDGITNKLIGCFYKPPPSKSCCANNIQCKDDCSNLKDISSNGDNNNIDDDCINHIENLRSNAVLIRVYGNKTDLLIDRKQEIENFQLLHKYEFAPCLYATFKNGLAYEFVPGVTLNRDNILIPKLWSLIACRMAEMHRLIKYDDGEGVNKHVEPMLLKKMELFFKLVPEQYQDAEKQKRLEGTFLPIKRMRDEFTELYKHLEKLHSPIVFSHNDLLLGNIIYTERENKVTFIDYEYADYNYQAFDIGNHFAEFAGVDTVDYTQYPNREFQLKWLRVYLEAYLQTNNVNNIQLECLYVQVNQFALAAHLFWTLWSLVQAEYSNINFDYVEYAYIRFNEYLRRKNEFLSLDFQN